MDNPDISIGKIRHHKNLDHSKFLRLYQKMMLGDTALSEDDIFFLLRSAVLFLNSEDKNIQKLGYRIVLRYSILHQDFEPLYEVAIGNNYTPIAKYIEKHHFPKDTWGTRFSNLLISSFQENFKIEGDGADVYRSIGQIRLNNFSRNDGDITIVAPTSYGKSEMIVRKVEQSIGKKVCVIVPSKALLAQTKKNLLRNHRIRKEVKRIVTHPDMFKKGTDSFVAVLTQERLLRLFQENRGLSLDLVLVDEAHNLLNDKDREQLLAQVILIAQKRNKDFNVNFFTPFLSNPQSISIFNHHAKIKDCLIDEHLKIERFYTYDVENKQMKFYDQFLNRAFIIPEKIFSNEIEFIRKHKAAKNIVYLNRPMHVENFAQKISDKIATIDLPPEVNKILKSISEYIHPKYHLIGCMNKGIVYHHGGMPDIIRLYVEDAFRRFPCFEHIITTSTLLEGVNIPAEKLFILNPKKDGARLLTPSQFKNLIGRICRFHEVFSPSTGSLKLLEPEIYLIKGQYIKQFALDDFYPERVSASVVVEDEVKNPLLEHSVAAENRDAILGFLENMEPGASGLKDAKKANSEIGQLCFINNVHDFDIIEHENRLCANLSAYKESHQGRRIDDSKELIEAIVSIFLSEITLNPESHNIQRLQKSEKARKFYSKFIRWRAKSVPYGVMINSFLKYWAELEAEGDGIIYVGPKWGEIRHGEGFHNLFVNISKKDESKRINLAIAKIKEEQDFVDFNILIYLEILHDLNLLDNDFYNKVKFGTSNKNIICLVKNGFSMELSRVLVSKYLAYLRLDVARDLVHYDENLITAMRSGNENDILIFEAENNI